MKKIVILAAFVFGAATAQQALACDWAHEASQAAVIVADGAAASALATNGSTDQERAKPEASAPQAAEAPNSSAPLTLACSGNNC